MRLHLAVVPVPSVIDYMQALRTGCGLYVKPLPKPLRRILAMEYLRQHPEEQWRTVDDVLETQTQESSMQILKSLDPRFASGVETLSTGVLPPRAPHLPPSVQVAVESSSSSRLPSPSLRQQQAESRPALMRAPSAPASNLVPPNLVPARSLARLPSNDGEPGPPQLPRALPPRLVAPAAFRHAPAGAQTQHRAPPPPRVHRAPPNPAIRAVPPSMPRAHPPP